MKMSNRKVIFHFLSAAILITCFCSTIFAQEKIIRYKRYEEPQEITNYFSIGGEYFIDDETFIGQAGLNIDFRLSSAFFMAAEGYVVTEDFKKYSFNVGAILNYKMGDEGAVPFFGAGVSLHIPTSKTLSTELVAKGNIGIIFDENIRFSVYYTTPVDHMFDYNRVGVCLGIQI